MSEDGTSLDLERWRGLDALGRRDALASLENLGTALETLGREIEAAARAEPALAADDAAALADTLGELDGAPAVARADLLRLAAGALANLGKHEVALTTLDSARQLAAEDPVVAARVDVASMQPLAKLGRVRDAIELGTRACGVLEREGRPDLAARGRFNLANLRKMSGDHAGALEELRTAEAELGSIAAIAATIENTRGESLLQLDRVFEARIAFERAIDAFEATESAYAMAMAIGNLGDLEARSGRFHEGLAAFDRAITLMRSVGAEPQARRLEVDRAALLQAVGLHEDAAEEASRLLPALATLPAEAARSWVVVARAALRRRDADSARVAASAALETAGDLEPWRTDAMLLAAESAMTAGAADEARGHLNAVDRGRLGMLHRAVTARIEAGIAITEGRVEDAIDTIDAIDADLLPEWVVAETMLPAIDALAIAGRIEDAIDRARDASRRIDAARTSWRTERLRAAWTGGRIEIHLRLIGLLLDRRGEGDLAEALAVAERARSRTLLEHLDRAIGESGEDDREVAGWRSELEALLSRLEDDDRSGRDRNGQDGDHEHRRDVAMAIAPARLERIRTLQRLIDDRLDATADPDLTPAARRPESLGAQATIAPDEAIITMLPTGSEIAFVLLRPGTTERLPLTASVREIEGLGDAIRFDGERWSAWSAGGPSADRRRDAALRRLRMLHRKLVEPLGSALDGVDRLVIVPTGSGQALPLHAALDADDLSLGERLAITLAPSLRIREHLLATTPPPRTPRWFVAGVADRRAPRIEAEARCVAEIHGDRPRLGGEATVETVAAGLSESTMAHIACHGRFEPAAPEASGLRLTDGWLTLRRLMACRLDLDLLVLSGCETARGRVAAGDEVAGLPHAAMRAGARRVVSSLWSVPDEDAAEFMIALHTRIAESRSADPADAIRHARRESRNLSPHPAGWAAFQVHGV